MADQDQSSPNERCMLLQGINDAFRKLQFEERKKCHQSFNTHYNGKYGTTRGVRIYAFLWEFVQQAPSTSDEFECIIVQSSSDIAPVKKWGLPDVSTWPIFDLENLKVSIKEKRVLVKALCSREAVVEAASHGRRGKEGGKNHERRYRPHLVLKERLMRTIETQIGRPLVSGNSKPIDPRRSDSNPPNLYRWQFSPEYPAFAVVKGGFSIWNAQHISRCNEALDSGELTVIAIQQGDEESERILEGPDILESQANNLIQLQKQLVPSSANLGDPSLSRRASAVNAQPQHAPSPAPIHNSTPRESLSDAGQELRLPATLLVLKEEIESIGDRYPSLEDLLGAFAEFHPRMVQKIIDEALKKQASELRTRLNLAHSKRVSDLEARLHVAKQELEVQGSARSVDTHIISDLRDEVRNFGKQLEDAEKRFTSEVSNAKQEGETSGREKAIEDSDASFEEERKALRRSHLDQIDRVRKAEYNKGFEAGQKFTQQEDIAVSIDNQGAIEALRDTIQQIEARHRQELISITEAAKREGREAAYKELAVGSQEKFNSNELNSSRKVRELKTICQHWKDVPQRVLPPEMLPEGHTPGDKTLYLLAKLSKEVTATKASSLLREEIQRRNLRLPEESRSGIVTNSDIRNALRALGSWEEGSSGKPLLSSELSKKVQSTRATQKTSSRSLNSDSIHGTRVELNEERYRQERRTVTGARDISPEFVPSMLASLKFPLASATTQQDAGVPVASATPLVNPFAAQRRREASKPALSTRRTLEEILAAFPTISDAGIPTSMQEFPSSFIRESIGGNEAPFAKVSLEMQKKQLVSWSQVIRINPENHPHAPTAGQHGALTFVEGKSGRGSIRSVYPAILRKSNDRLSYIGHYLVVDHETVPVNIWKGWAQSQKDRIAKEIDESVWGDELLTKRGIEIQGGTLEARMSQILSSFERTDTPNLRMSWTVLQFHKFEHKDYLTLRSEFKRPSRRQESSPHAQFLAARKLWLSSGHLGDTTGHIMDDLRNGHCTAISKEEYEALDRDVLRHAKSAGMVGKRYSPGTELNELKQYLASLTQQLRPNFSFGPLDNVSDIVKLFDAIYHIFDDHNNRQLSESTARKMKASTPSAIVASRKHRMSKGQDSEQHKRPKFVVLLDGKQSAMSKARNNALASMDGGGNIFVDTSEIDFKNSPAENGEVEENIYDEDTPPPTVNSNVEGKIWA